jgi:peptidyl-prolyl cis-trans isomerase D
MAALFKMQKGEVSDTPLSTQDGFLMARVADVKPAGFEPLEAVSDVIKDRLTAEEGQKRARTKADELAKAMETPEGRQKVLDEYKGKVAVSQPFTRQGFIPGLGMAPVLAQTAFEAKDPGWFKAAYAVSDGYVLAGLDKRVPAEAALWDKEKDRWLQTLTQTKRTELFNAYLKTVQEAAKVEIVNDQILGPRTVPGKAPAGAGN